MRQSRDAGLMDERATRGSGSLSSTSSHPGFCLTTLHVSPPLSLHISLHLLTTSFHFLSVSIFHSSVSHLSLFPPSPSLSFHLFFSFSTPVHTNTFSSLHVSRRGSQLFIGRCFSTPPASSARCTLEGNQDDLTLPTIWGGAFHLEAGCHRLSAGSVTEVRTQSQCQRMDSRLTDFKSLIDQFKSCSLNRTGRKY